MGRVSQETLDKLAAFIDSLPIEARAKCAMCNETLTHIVKQAEAQTGAGTATVCRVLAEQVNDGAAAGDVVTPGAMRERVRTKEGMNICRNPENNNPEPEKEDRKPAEKPHLERHVVDNGILYDGPRYGDMAIEQLRCIKKEDPQRVATLIRVKAWIDDRLNQH